jgi:hypothetical protein
MPSNLGGLQGISAARENHRANMKDWLTQIMNDTIVRELPLPEGSKPSFKTGIAATQRSTAGQPS